MKLKPQHTPELTRLGELIEGMPVAMMATQDEVGAIVSRPMTTLEMDAQGVLWLFTDMRSTKLKQHQAVNLLFADGKAMAMGEHKNYPDLRSNRDNHDGRSRVGDARAIPSV